MSEAAELAQNFFTFESRLASFQTTQKKRGSNASAKAKPQISWPHKTIAPADLAKAGFFYHPLGTHPDQVLCFLCHKALDGWEAGDDPLHEHLTHAPGCGWAIGAAIQAKIDGYADMDPMDVDMLNARKMTFAARWPHENKRGWKCKSKQLAEAGWHYTPIPDSQDMATCAYCHLALDGWEPGDKPLNEHFSRAPECAFFRLAAQNQGPKKTTAKGRGASAARTPRLSLQSEAPSFMDTTADVEDSIMTTASNATTTSKKGGRTRKAPPKARKTRVKRDEPEEVVDDDGDGDDDNEHALSPPPPQQRATAGRGRKRGSEAMEEESVAPAPEVPAAKKRATRTRSNSTADNSAVTQQDDSLVVEKPMRGRKSAAKGKRVVSDISFASDASGASLLHTTQEQAESDPDELVRRLETTVEQEALRTPENSGYVMFDLTPAQFDEEGLEEEFRELQQSMRAGEATEQPRGGKEEGNEVEELYGPEKNDTPEPTMRKSSGSSRLNESLVDDSAAHVSVSGEPPGGAVDAPAPGEQCDSTTVSQPKTAQAQAEAKVHGSASDAANTSLTSATSTSSGTEVVKTARKRGRPPKKSKSEASKIATQEEEPNAADGAVKAQAKDSVGEQVGEQAEANVAAAGEPADAMQVDDVPSDNTRQPSSRAQTPDVTDEHAEEMTPATTSPRPPSSSVVPSSVPRHHLLSTPPRPRTSPDRSARQPVLSPSQSPQSSDAENLAPSIRPPEAVKRVEMAPLPVATPSKAMLSPSKKGIIPAGRIRTDGTPWKGVDLDAVFASFEGLSGENGSGSLWSGNELSAEEKDMTVEQWIIHNATLAEGRMRQDCEVMVSRFESEGGRAMRVLGGLVIDS